MISKSIYRSLLSILTIWNVTAIIGCSTLTPVAVPTAVKTKTAISTKTPVLSATSTLTPEPSPTPYTGPNLLFYIQYNMQGDSKFFSVNADGSNQQEPADGVQFSLSPDRQKLVYRTAYTFGSDNDQVVVLDLSQGEIIYQWNIPGYCEGLLRSSEFDWSPDSQRIAFTLTRHDGVDPIPNCNLQFNYEDMGIYQIDLRSSEIVHPPLADIFIRYLNTPALYSPDGSKIRLGPRGEAFDVETWEKVRAEPLYDVIQLCNQPVSIGICNRSNLCLYNEKSQIFKYLTQYRAHPEISVQSYESVNTFKVFANCSSVVYDTQRWNMHPLTPEPNNDLIYFLKPLHVMSLTSESDLLISVDAWAYVLTPDSSKIVIYERRDSTGEPGIFIVNRDGSNRRLIAEFMEHEPKIYGSSMVISPTGEKVAFVNSAGIAIVNLDGSNLVQLIDLRDSASADKISLEILDWY